MLLLMLLGCLEHGWTPEARVCYASPFTALARLNAGSLPDRMAYQVYRILVPRANAITPVRVIMIRIVSRTHQIEYTWYILFLGALLM